MFIRIALDRESWLKSSSWVSRMTLVRVHESVWMEILWNWCGPADYLAMVSTSKLQSNALVLRDAACFAVSRFHAPGFDSFFSMQQWTSVWNQCVDAFRGKGWPVGLWKHSCRVYWGKCRFLPQEPFYKCLNDMAAGHFAGHSVVSVLAASIDLGRPPPNAALAIAGLA